MSYSIENICAVVLIHIVFVYHSVSDWKYGRQRWHFPFNKTQHTSIPSKNSREMLYPCDSIETVWIGYDFKRVVEIVRSLI